VQDSDGTSNDVALTSAVSSLAFLHGAATALTAVRAKADDASSAVVQSAPVTPQTSARGRHDSSGSASTSDGAAARSHSQPATPTRGRSKGARRRQRARAASQRHRDREQQQQQQQHQQQQQQQQLTASTSTAGDASDALDLAGGGKSVADWLASLQLAELTSLFAAEQVTWDVLPTLTSDDLRDLGVKLGPRKKLLAAIGAMSGERDAARRHSTSSTVSAGSSLLESSDAAGDERVQVDAPVNVVPTSAYSAYWLEVEQQAETRAAAERAVQQQEVKAVIEQTGFPYREIDYSELKLQPRPIGKVTLHTHAHAHMRLRHHTFVGSVWRCFQRRMERSSGCCQKTDDVL
jgi:hypothetical protein